ncbi:MAG: hypothetical protein ACRDY3_00755 [Acidimicrobiales bacterium]
MALIPAVALAVSRERRDKSQKVHDHHRRQEASLAPEGFEEGPSTTLDAVEALAANAPQLATVARDKEIGG